MTQIKSLADQLRECMRDGPDVRVKPVKMKQPIKDLPPFLQQIVQYQTEGKEKLLIRLDTRTILLLKQLKVATGIDMVQFITYAVKQLLDNHPELPDYIKQSLDNF